MRKLVFSIIVLIALFSALRAWTDPPPAPGVRLHPGLVEVSDGTSSLQLGFGLMEREPGTTSFWSVLPLRLAYSSGGRSVSLALNGLSFIFGPGVTIGRPLQVASARTGDVVSLGGPVTVDARVDGDVWTIGANIVLSPRAVVTGNVVALGGRVSASPRAVVRGVVSQVPRLRLPFRGAAGLTVPALALGRQVVGYCLLGAALFVTCFYGTTRARGLYDGMGRRWRMSLVILVACLVLVPVIIVLLILSVVGVFFLPVLIFALAVIGLNGFLLLCSRVGGALRRVPSEGTTALFLFTSGLLGLFLVKVPAVAGIILAMTSSPAAAVIGQVLRLVTLWLFLVGILYGTGASLATMRTQRSVAAR